LKRPTVAPRYKCTSPIQVKWRALEAYIGVRCRSCPGCMRVRQYGWSARAAREQALAKRTWFVTLTFKPSERAAIMAAASADLSAKPPEQRLITAAGVSVTAYMKTLRKRGFKLGTSGFLSFIVTDSRTSTVCCIQMIAPAGETSRVRGGRGS